MQAVELTDSVPPLQIKVKGEEGQRRMGWHRIHSLTYETRGRAVLYILLIRLTILN